MESEIKAWKIYEKDIVNIINPKNLGLYRKSFKGTKKIYIWEKKANFFVYITKTVDFGVFRKKKNDIGKRFLPGEEKKTLTMLLKTKRNCVGLVSYFPGGKGKKRGLKKKFMFVWNKSFICHNKGKGF